jgi:LuxR family maltose regulon positive regulatory protein
MTRPLLTTKLHIPTPRAGLVSRPHLIARLDEALRSHHRLILLSAPAGFGKTTLLAEWIAGLQSGESPRAQVAWITLDEGDNDPARFFAYLVAALQPTDAIIGPTPRQAGQSTRPSLRESRIVRLINHIAALPHACMLVLDDYHLIASQAIHDAVTFLVDHAPENLHLVLATRGDPPLPLARLRARHQLTELRQSDLRFTAQEAAAFLNTVMGLGLSVEDVAALEVRTEGLSLIHI